MSSKVSSAIGIEFNGMMAICRLSREDAVAQGPEVYRLWKISGAYLKEYGGTAERLYAMMESKRATRQRTQLGVGAVRCPATGIVIR